MSTQTGASSAILHLKRPLLFGVFAQCLQWNAQMAQKQPGVQLAVQAAGMIPAAGVKHHTPNHLHGCTAKYTKF